MYTALVRGNAPLLQQPSHTFMLSNIPMQYRNQQNIILITVSTQKLQLFSRKQLIADYRVSTSKYGTGSNINSNKTPLGLHRIRQKIGHSATLGTVFKGRVNQGYVADIQRMAQATSADHITSRIMWLEGLEPGRNQGADVDSYTRYIYIHGTHEEGLIGQQASHGCIRMLNQDVIDLYDRIQENDLVFIAP